MPGEYRTWRSARVARYVLGQYQAAHSVVRWVRTGHRIACVGDIATFSAIFSFLHPSMPGSDASYVSNEIRKVDASYDSWDATDEKQA
eukprot:1411810-Rhodomonas_salina.2